MKHSKEDENYSDLIKYVVALAIVTITITVLLVVYAINRSKHMFPSLEENTIVEDVEYK